MKRTLLLCGLLFIFLAGLRAQSTVPTLASPIAPQSLTVGAPAAEFDLSAVFSVPGVTGEVVQFDTVLGKFNVETLATAAPNHVANFLAYVNAGDYSNTFFHRVASFEGGTAGPSILQGGGYYAVNALTPVTKRTAVNLEYSLPNARGTLAAARTSSPNTATSEWFFNTRDNSTILGPLNDGFGYTVFARVIGTGMTIVDAIAAKPIINIGGAFATTPMRDTTPDQTNFTVDNLITVKSTTVIPLFPASTGERAVVSFTVASDQPNVATATLVAGHTLSLNPVGAGSATLTLTATDTNGNTAQTSVPVTVAGNPATPVPTKTQTIKFTAPAPKLANAASFDLVASATSKLPVSFEVISGPALLGPNGRALSMTGSGTVIVKASQAGNSTYLAALPVQASFKVTQATQKISFRAPSSAQLAFDSIPLTASASSGLPVTFQIVSGAAILGADGRSFILTGSGPIGIRATQTGSSLYQAAPPAQVTVNIVPRAQTITFNPPADALLNRPPVLLAATASSGLPVLLAVASGPAVLGNDNRTLTFTGSGTVTLSATQSGSIRIKAAPPVTKKNYRESCPCLPQHRHWAGAVFHLRRPARGRWLSRPQCHPPSRYSGWECRLLWRHHHPPQNLLHLQTTQPYECTVGNSRQLRRIESGSRRPRTPRNRHGHDHARGYLHRPKRKRRPRGHSDALRPIPRHAQRV